MRGTFANIRLRNELAPGTEGSWTTHLPSGEVMSVFDAAERYRGEAAPLAVLAGKEYGSGSSRDWAAKGPMLLGVRFVIAESYERIHRSNLVGMGVLPLQFVAGESARRSASTAPRRSRCGGLDAGIDARVSERTVEAVAGDGTSRLVRGHGAHRRPGRARVLPGGRHPAAGARADAARAAGLAPAAARPGSGGGSVTAAAAGAGPAPRAPGAVRGSRR